MEIGSKALWLFALAAVCSRVAAAQTPDSARRAQVVALTRLQPVNQGETEPARRPAWLEASAGIDSSGARHSKVGMGELVGGVVGGIVGGVWFAHIAHGCPSGKCATPSVALVGAAFGSVAGAFVGTAVSLALSKRP